MDSEEILNDSQDIFEVDNNQGSDVSRGDDDTAIELTGGGSALDEEDSQHGD